MKRLAVSIALVTTALVGISGGYWLGFRHAWEMGLMADAPVRGALAMHYLRALEKDQTDNLRTSFEADIDAGLMLWAQLEDYPLFRTLNALSGHEVIPEVERYVRRIATYRKGHKSPLREPALVEKMLSEMREKDPEFAADLEASGHHSDTAIDRMIEKYAE